MPKIGEIRHGREINRARTQKYIWSTCVDCGKERWVQLSHGTCPNPRCRSCASKRNTFYSGNKNHFWRGGRRQKESGYIQILLSKDDFFYPMATKQDYVLEHRLIMAKYLGRCLLSWEIVHHKGTKYPQGSIENRGDNRIENLELLPTSKYHMPSMRWQEEINKLSKRIRQLEARITLVEAENIILSGHPVKLEIKDGTG